MGSQELNLVQPQRMENGLSSQMVFQDKTLQFSRSGGDHDAARKARAGAEVTGFVVDGDKGLSSDQDGRFFQTQGAELRRCMYSSSGRPGRDHHPQRHDWNADGSAGTPSGDGSDEEDDDDDDDDDDEDDDVDEGDGVVDGLVSDRNNKNNDNSSGSVQSSSEKIQGEKSNLQERHSSFGSSRGVLAKDGSEGRGNSSEQQHQPGRMGHYENAITVVEPEMYYTQILHGGDGPSIANKEIGGENGCGFSGRKEVGLSVDFGESMRTYLSDPITGVLMDDAIILPCGHSYGNSGMQHIIRMKICYKCAQPISENSVRPNLALRSAVQAFRREEDSQSSKASKRRRERFEQDKYSYDDPYPMDLSRGKGVQFPFVVSDRVIIKGNKRTPQRFVGRVAVVTTQCLNGWYVVKTLDNAESVKLQYRSLAKFTEDTTPNMVSNKPTAPNWL